MCFFFFIFLFYFFFSFFFPFFFFVFFLFFFSSHSGQFYDQYLRDIKLNPDDVDWSVEDLSYLSSADAYRSWLHSHVAAARTIYSVGEVAGIVNSFDYQAETDDVDKKDNSKHEFRMLYRGIPGNLDQMLSQTHNNN